MAKGGGTYRQDISRHIKRQKLDALANSHGRYDEGSNGMENGKNDRKTKKKMRGPNPGGFERIEVRILGDGGTRSEVERNIFPNATSVRNMKLRKNMLL